jgi:hypothetical protein
MFWSGVRNAPRLAAGFFLGNLSSKIKSNLRMQYTDGYLSQDPGAPLTLPNFFLFLIPPMSLRLGVVLRNAMCELPTERSSQGKQVQRPAVPQM